MRVPRVASAWRSLTEKISIELRIIHSSMLKEMPFVDREAEMAFLNKALTRRNPSPAGLILLYGRRRIGKSSLLKRWAVNSGVPHTYWVAEKEPAPLQRRKLLARLWGVEVEHAPLTSSWEQAWRLVAGRIGDARHILILDELPYAAESDPAMLSSLQHAWDGLFQRSNIVICLCGSHVRTMETLMSRQSPLFGRLTGQWHLEALPFSALAELFPKFSVEERVALYGIAGGVPAYLSWLNPALDLSANISQEILDPGGLFIAEPEFLLYDEVRERGPHMAVLKSIGRGFHTLDEISNESLIGKNNLSIYLARLQELRLVERRLPVTIPPRTRTVSRKGRYHLSDAFFRFYFRFIAPAHDRIGFEREAVLTYIRTHLRGFISVSAFEPLARQWLAWAGQSGAIGVQPELVGAHWSRQVQIDVVGVNWTHKQIVLGECKWGVDAVDRQVVRELVEDKTPKLLAELPDAGAGWAVTPVIFSRRAITPAARALLTSVGGVAVTAAELARGLG
jgi:uncharacterized protein